MSLFVCPFVYLFVCLLATLCKNFRTDLHKNFQRRLAMDTGKTALAEICTVPVLLVFYLVNFRAAQSLTATLCCCFSILYSATAAAVVQSRLHEPYSVYYFALFYVLQKVSCSFVPSRSHQILTTPLQCKQI